MTTLSALPADHFKTLCMLAREMYQDELPPNDFLAAEPSDSELARIREHCKRLDGKKGYSLAGYANIMMLATKRDARKRNLNGPLHARALQLGLLAWKMAEIVDGPFTPDDWAAAIIEARQARQSPR